MTTVTCTNIIKRYDNGYVATDDISLTVNAGEFLVLVGPSGCGKSTLLRMIAGLESITSGTLAFDKDIVNDWEPRRRDIGMVFQNYALYPHLTVGENIAFPLRVRKESKEAITKRVEEVATMLDVHHVLGNLPKQLSGGQRQRVALGRAIARTPRVFLFDEPLSNLDAHLRAEMRSELITLQRKVGSTAVYVTHDHTEAMTMGDRIAVLNKGKLCQIGTPAELYSNPASLFVAGFIGSPAINMVKGFLIRQDGVRFVSDDGLISVPLNEGSSILKRLGSLEGKRPYTLAFRAEYVCIAETHQTPSAIGTIHLKEFLGHEQIVTVFVGNNKLSMRQTGVNSSAQTDSEIPLLIKPEGLLLFDEQENSI
jgi:ABC-type sugar transport system ATPase subunit